MKSDLTLVDHKLVDKSHRISWTDGHEPYLGTRILTQ